MDILNFFLGLAVGLATNLLSWWLLFHGIVPKMRFSQSIGKTESQDIGHDKSGLSYVVKFENSGRRTIIDLEVMARLSITNLEPNKDRTHVFLVPLNPDGNLVFRWPESLPLGKTDKSRHRSRLFINSSREHLDRPPYPDHIRTKAREGTITLEELLRLGTKAELKIYAFGYDKFSGTRKLFISPPYTVEDIIEGVFDENGLDINPKPIRKTQKGKISPANTKLQKPSKGTRTKKFKEQRSHLIQQSR